MNIADLLSPFDSSVEYRTISPQMMNCQFSSNDFLRYPKANHDTIYRLFTTLFILLHDEDIGKECFDPLIDISRNILLKIYSRLIHSNVQIYVPDGELYNSSTSSFIFPVPSNLQNQNVKTLQLEPPILPILKYIYPCRYNSLSPFILNEAFVNSLSLLYKNKSDINAITYINEIYKITTKICPVDVCQGFGHYYEDLTIKLINCCLSKNWALAYGCINIINELMKIMPSGYCQRYSCHIGRVLLSILEVCPSEWITHFEPLINNGFIIMLKRITEQGYQYDKNYSLNKSELYKDTIECIIYYLINPSSICRKIANNIFCKFIMDKDKYIDQEQYEKIIIITVQKLKAYYQTFPQSFPSASIYVKMGFLDGYLNFFVKTQKTEVTNSLSDLFSFFRKDTLALLPDDILTKKQLILRNMEAVKNCGSGYNPSSPFSELIIVEYRKKVLNFGEYFWLKSYEVSNFPFPEFFNLCIQSLGCVDESVVETAFRILNNIQPHISKDYKNYKNTLFEVLNPILTKLSDCASLNRPMLKTLNYVLKLFGNSFSPDLSKRIANHLEFWIKQDTQTNKTDENILIIVELIDIFHLTPDQNAKAFMDPIVMDILKIESTKFPKTDHYNYNNSPLRLSLVHCCNRHPSDFKDFLISENKISLPNSTLLFYDILNHPEADKFRAELEQDNSFQKLISLCSSKSRSQVDYTYHVIRVINILASHEKTKLFMTPNYKKVMEILLKPWQGRNLWLNSSPTKLQIITEEEPKLIVDTLLIFLHHEISDLNVVWLFELCRCFTHRCIVDFSYVAEFLRDFVPVNYSDLLKEHILQYFSTKLLPQNNLDEVKTAALKYLVTPLVAKSFKSDKSKEPQFLEHSVELLVNNITAEQIAHRSSEKLRIEMLKFLTLLLENTVVKNMIPIIKFAWNHLKNEDLESRSWAFFTIARFFLSYEKKDHLIQQVFIAILKPNPSDPQGMIYKAYHLLMKSVNGVNMSGIISKITRHLEDDSNDSVYIHIWKLITLYPQFYYPYFSNFKQFICQSVKLLFAKQSTDSRILSINVIDYFVSCLEKDRRAKDQLDTPPELDYNVVNEIFYEEASGKRRIDQTNVANKRLKYNNFVNEFDTIFKEHRNKIFEMLINITLYMCICELRQLGRCYELIKSFLKLFPTINLGYINLLDQVRCEEILKRLIPISSEKEKKARCENIKLAYFRICIIFLTIPENPFYKEHLSDVIQLFKQILDDKECQNKFIKMIDAFSEDFFTAYKENPERYEPIAKELELYINNCLKISYDEVIKSKTNAKDNIKTKYGGYIILTRLKYIIKFYPPFIDRFYKQLMDLSESFLQYLSTYKIKYVGRPIKQENVSEYYKLLEDTFSEQYISSLGFISYIYSLRINEYSISDKKIYYNILISSIKNIYFIQYANYIIIILYNIITGNKISVINDNVDDLTDEKIDDVKNAIKETNNNTSINEIKAILLYLLQYPLYNTMYYNLLHLIIYCCCLIDISSQKENVIQLIEVGITQSEMKLKLLFLELFNEIKYVSKDVYSRLKYIFSIPKSHFIVKKNWVTFSSIILLDSIDSNYICKLSEDSILFPVIRKAIKNYTEQGRDLDVFMLVVKDNLKYQKNVLNRRSSEFINSLMSIVTFDPYIGHYLFINLFKEAYSSLSEIDMSNISILISLFLSTPINQSHSQLYSTLSYGNNIANLDYRDNICSISPSNYIALPSTVKTLFTAITQLDPLPILSTQTLYFLLSVNDIKIIVIYYLQKLIDLNIGDIPSYKILINKYYHYVQDTENEIGNLSSNTNNEKIREGLYNEIRGNYEEAQSNYVNVLMSKDSNENDKKVADNRWVECGRILRQWDILKDYSERNNDILLQLESNYRLQNYNEVVNLYESKGNSQETQGELLAYYNDPVQFMTYYVSSAYFLQKKESSKKALFNLKIQIYNRWKLSETVITPLFLPILNNSQLLMEFTEAPDEAKKSTDISLYREITWDNQNPSLSDNILIWDDLYLWRKTFLESIRQENSNDFHKTLPLILKNIGLSIKLANIAIKQKLYVTCATYLRSIENIEAIDKNDLYKKIKIELLLKLNTGLIKQGLEDIKYYPMSLFQSKEKKSNLFYYKVLFTLKNDELEKRPHNPELISKLCYSGIESNPENSKLWCEWGKFYDKLYIANDPSRENEEYAYQAICCYFHTLHINAPKYQLYLGRIFYLSNRINMLSYKPNMSDLIKNVPHWLWLKDLNHYFIAIKSPNNDYAYELLRAIEKTYPQYIIPALRYYMTFYYKRHHNDPRAIRNPKLEQIFDYSRKNISFFIY